MSKVTEFTGMLEQAAGGWVNTCMYMASSQRVKDWGVCVNIAREGGQGVTYNKQQESRRLNV